MSGVLKRKRYAEEYCALMSIRMKEKWQDSTYRQIMCKTRVGRTHSEETRMKMSEARKGRVCTEETKEKLRLANTGFRLSEATKRKLSRRHKGKRLSEETKRKISESLKGEKSSCWQGGISRLSYSFDFNNELKEKIKERDNHTCQLCGNRERLAIHHIDYNKMNSEEYNLVTLCSSCNSKVNFHRPYWQDYFRGYCNVSG